MTKPKYGPSKSSASSAVASVRWPWWIALWKKHKRSWMMTWCEAQAVSSGSDNGKSTRCCQSPIFPLWPVGILMISQWMEWGTVSIKIVFYDPFKKTWAIFGLYLKRKCLSILSPFDLATTWFSALSWIHESTQNRSMFLKCPPVVFTNFILNSWNHHVFGIFKGCFQQQTPSRFQVKNRGGANASVAPLATRYPKNLRGRGPAGDFMIRIYTYIYINIYIYICIQGFPSWDSLGGDLDYPPGQSTTMMR